LPLPAIPQASDDLMTKAPQAEQAAACRALARRARRLAGTLVVDRDRDDLIGYANELEAQAEELEAARPLTDD
jgi:cob(I)alamin adenosyltransferase